MPNLLEVQKTSYQWFLDVGLKEVFKDVGSIVDYGGNLELSFVDFSMDEQPKYDVEECKARDATYAAPIKVKVQLRNTQNNQINEQEIFMGDFPIMTNSGTFVINGAERVIVSQIVRSPGMYYTREVDKADNKTYSTTVIPGQGAWLEYETDLSDVFYVRIDKNRKLPVTCLIRALGPAATRKFWSSLARTSAFWPPWRRMPARAMRRPCWRSTASCVPASPHAGLRRDPHQRHLLRPPAVRPVHRGPLQVQQEDGPVDPAGRL